MSLPPIFEHFTRAPANVQIVEEFSMEPGDDYYNQLFVPVLNQPVTEDNLYLDIDWDLCAPRSDDFPQARHTGMYWW